MASAKERFKKLKISERARQLLSPEDLKSLEEGIERLKRDDIPEADLSSEKFDAKGMQPVGGGPVNWNPSKKHKK